MEPDLLTRLRRAQTDVDDAEAATKLRREQRRKLVHQAVDEHQLSAREVASALGRGTGLVSKILATPAPEEAES